MKRRDLIQALLNAGYRIVRDKGNHTVLSKPGSRILQVPRHHEVKEGTAIQILKDAGLK